MRRKSLEQDKKIYFLVEMKKKKIKYVKYFRSKDEMSLGNQCGQPLLFMTLAWPLDICFHIVHF